MFDPLVPAILSVLMAGGIKGTTKSLQSGIFLASASLWSPGTGIDTSYQDITINTVVPENCRVSVQVAGTASNGSAANSVAGRMVNATTLRLSIAINSSTARGTWQVEELYL